jgi:transcription elongation factor
MCLIVNSVKNNSELVKNNSTSNRNNTNNNSIDVFICEENRISDHETLKIDLNIDESDKNTKK